MNEYDKQANDFLAKTGTKITIEYLKTGIHFEGDEYERDIYLITLTRGPRSYSFNFGNSLACSGKYHKYGDCFRGISHSKTCAWPHEWDRNKNFSVPKPYDILACLTTYDPDTFENFCGDYGYDIDSRKAEKIYNAVRAEYHNICCLFSDEEMEELREIN